jgi:hypothetical protein
MAPQPIWTPNNTKHTAINAFWLYVNRTYHKNFLSYFDLHEWSVNNIPDFAEAVFTFTGIRTSSPYVRVVDGLEAMYPPSRWFPGARMNYTENLLCAGLGMRPNGVAVTVCEEGAGKVRDLTFIELEQETAIWATALRRLGVGVGDRVASKSQPVSLFLGVVTKSRKLFCLIKSTAFSFSLPQVPSERFSRRPHPTWVRLAFSRDISRYDPRS